MNTLNVGQGLLLGSSVIHALQESGVLTGDGTFSDDPTKIATAANMIKGLLVQQGLAIDPKVDKIIAAIPLILALTA
jgi:hypothetical protein